MFSNLSNYWLDEHHADGEVQLATQSSCSDCCSNPAANVVARIPVHCVVLSAASSYFSTMLGPSWHHSSTNSSSGRAAVRLVLGEPADAAAAIALCKCIYTQHVEVTPADINFILKPSPCSCCADAVRACFDSSHSQQLQLRVVQLADQLAVPGVMDAVTTKLTNLFTHQVRVDVNSSYRHVT